MKIFASNFGGITPNPGWVCIHNGYMYVGENLKRLIEVLNTEWEHDRWLA